MLYTLYRLNKIKIVFENYRLIDTKLFQPTVNYLKFYSMNYFVKCIQDYGSAINYNMA